MTRTLRTGAALAATSVALLALSANATAAVAHHEEKGQLQVCAYHLGDDKITVTADGKKVATYPRMGRCKTKDRDKGSYTIRVSGLDDRVFDRAVVKDPTGDSSGSDSSLPVSVRVHPGLLTQVNLYFAEQD